MRKIRGNTIVKQENTMKIQSKFKEDTIQIQSKRHQNKPYSKSDLVVKRKNTRGIRGNTRLKQETTRKNSKISQGTCCKTRGPGRIPKKYDENTWEIRGKYEEMRGNARKYEENTSGKRPSLPRRGPWRPPGPTPNKMTLF